MDSQSTVTFKQSLYSTVAVRSTRTSPGASSEDPAEYMLRSGVRSTLEAMSFGSSPGRVPPRTLAAADFFLAARERPSLVGEYDKDPLRLPVQSSAASCTVASVRRGTGPHVRGGPRGGNLTLAVLHFRDPRSSRSSSRDACSTIEPSRTPPRVVTGAHPPS